MNMEIAMKKVLILTAVALLSACAQPNNSGSVYRASQTQNEQSVRMGYVESVREVTIDKGQTGVARQRVRRWRHCCRFQYRRR
jgi:outer membrane lipoprotein SlyB